LAKLRRNLKAEALADLREQLRQSGGRGAVKLQGSLTRASAEGLN
jgi:hypothetical protein